MNEVEIHITERIMRKSVVDVRRIERMNGMGCADDECPYHTAYEWADAVDALTRSLKKQLENLKDVYYMLYALETAQRTVQVAIDQIEKEIAREEAIVGEFWKLQPNDFKR
jgi:hypothetical protein